MVSSSVKGIELGKLVLSSGLLDSSWSKISKIHKSSYPNKDSGLGIKIFREAKFTFVVFAAPPIRRSCSLIPASTLLSGSKDQNPFHLLCSEKISSFSLHTPAFQLFASAYKALSHLKSELLESKKQVIITGAALGGSVASLFTLWLLETVEPGQTRPLCITFGSPLIGDASLQQILENSVSSSCFLHVAADAAQTPITEGFEPFGTFLICYESECVCVEDPVAVKELLKGVSPDLVDYGQLLHRLNQSVLSTADSGLITNGAIIRMEARASDKNPPFDPFMILDKKKIPMMHIEWYKKKSKEAKYGYYDQYRFKIPTTVDIKVASWKKELNDYWTWVVEDAEKKPQSDISILKRRFLYAGNNYRRLIEPLDIAEYYRNGGKDYRTSVKGRSSHYVILEKWFGDASIESTRCEKRVLSDLLTFDSCFWAEVEEAMIVTKSVKTQVGMRGGEREELLEKLVKFEEYMAEMIRKREVSPEIFLEKSSFMKWWKEYKEIKGGKDGFGSPHSHLTEFMNTGTYRSYGQ